jgi:hypothetical protein
MPNCHGEVNSHQIFYITKDMVKSNFNFLPSLKPKKLKFYNNQIMSQFSLSEIYKKQNLFYTELF